MIRCDRLPCQNAHLPRDGRLRAISRRADVRCGLLTWLKGH